MFYWGSNQSNAVKLPASRVQELIGKGFGKRLRPAPDRADWEWLELTREAELCLALVSEAYRYVNSLEHHGPEVS